MPEVIGIRFKPVTKIYYFLPPGDTSLQVGDPVIVETSRGKELGWVALEKKSVSKKEIKGDLKTVLRRATPLDLMKMTEHKGQQATALEKCKVKVAELDLPMKVVAAEYSFDGSRILFSFSAEQRVDFRNLVRVLVRSLRTRVEMRQIGARDEAKIIDGYGRCGRRLCCSSWLTEFHPVSIRMAKNQQLPLAPTEISGVCGRLLCCLAYEDKMYSEIRKELPRVGSTISTEEGTGIIKGLNILKQTVIVEMEATGTRVEVPVSPVEAPQTEVKQPKAKLKARAKSSKPKRPESKPSKAKSSRPKQPESKPSKAKSSRPKRWRRSHSKKRKSQLKKK